MIALLIFILILGLLIFVHEFGHFITARRNGIKIYEFGFGFPPRLFGIQLLTGKKIKKVAVKRQVEIDIVDSKKDNIETIEETVLEETQEIDKIVPFRKWRFIWGSKDGDDESEKEDLSEAHKNKYAGGTIYSINLIPIGGFVRIKGEDGGNRGDADSFISKKAWTRIKVLAAGVAMNFVLAWILISIGLMMGDPEPMGINKSDASKAVIQITEITPDSPAQISGLKVGDEISKTQVSPDGSKISIVTEQEVQDYINSNKGKEIKLAIKRSGKNISIKITPRDNAPSGQGPLGIAFQSSIFVKYPWYQALTKGFIYTLNLIWLIVSALWGLLAGLLSGKGAQGVEVTGPIGIFQFTKQVSQMGLIYLIHLTAILSINLGIINILPIPALDGGRILFIIIEKIKGSPVNQKIEQAFHTVFFFAFLMLMLLITFKEIPSLWK